MKNRYYAKVFPCPRLPTLYNVAEIWERKGKDKMDLLLFTSDHPGTARRWVKIMNSLEKSK